MKTTEKYRKQLMEVATKGPLKEVAQVGVMGIPNLIEDIEELQAKLKASSWSEDTQYETQKLIEELQAENKSLHAETEVLGEQWSESIKLYTKYEKALRKIDALTFITGDEVSAKRIMEWNRIAKEALAQEGIKGDENNKPTKG